MPDDPEIQRRSVRLVIRLGTQAPRFASMVARQFDQLGDTRQSEIWESVAALSTSLLDALAPRRDRLVIPPHR